MSEHGKYWVSLIHSFTYACELRKGVEAYGNE